MSTSTNIWSPDGKYAVEQQDDYGEVGMGSPKFGHITFRGADIQFPDYLFGETVLFSPDSRFVALEQLVETRPFRTKLIAVELPRGTIRFTHLQPQGTAIPHRWESATRLIFRARSVGSAAELQSWDAVPQVLVAPAMPDKIKSRKGRILIAWLVGGFIYMFFAIEVVMDAGFLAIPFQLVIGAVFSIVCVGFAALAGLLLRVPALARVWYSSSLPSFAVLAAAAFLIFFGRDLGLSTHPVVPWGSMLAAVFATLHFSGSHDSNTPNQSAS